MFLAVTGLLVAGMFVGTGANLARERYNDGVAGVEEFLAQQFSLVQNPERAGTATRNQVCIAPGASPLTNIDSPNATYVTTQSGTGEFRGRSNCLIYGRIIEFGTVGSFGLGSRYPDKNANDQVISARTVVGRDLESYAIQNDDINYLNRLIAATDNDRLNYAKLGRADDAEYFFPTWGVTVADYNAASSSLQNNLSQGGILIVRMPLSGSVRTFSRSDTNTTSINALASDNAAGNFIAGASSINSRYLCVIPSDNIWNPIRKVVRVRQNIGNISAISVLPTDTAADDGGAPISCR
jgi:hypothetical protein